MSAPERPRARVHVRARLALIAAVFCCANAAAQLFDGSPPYVVTPQRVADRMLALARVTASDHLIDLGSGDGRIVIAAAKRHGASGLGVEIRADLVALSQSKAEQEGVADRVRFARQDALQTDLAPASVLTLYLSPELNDRLLPRILETMRPGARIIGHDFGIGTWTPDHTERMQVPEKNHGRGGESVLMLWVVPANAAGRWRAVIGAGSAKRTLEFSISQQFQVIEATLHAAGRGLPFARAGLNAERITLELPETFPVGADTRVVSARIEGDRMTGNVGGGAAALRFSAERIQARPDPF